eukprot:6590371-Pyramimonas_sp.AAC.1
MVAGHMTKSNIIGYVVAIRIPQTVRQINAFTMGVRAVSRRYSHSPCLVYTRSGHQSRKGVENIPTAGTNRGRGERTYVEVFIQLSRCRRTRSRTDGG